MKKIENFDEVKKTSDEVVSFDSLPIGPQICKILKVKDVVNKEYLQIEFDIADGDYKGFFADQKKNFNNEDWPSQGTLYKSYKSTAYKFFASFIIAIEKSNPKFEWVWDETKLEGQYFVANFAEEEWLDDTTNEIKVNVKCREVRSIQALKEGEVKLLKKKELSDSEKQKSQAGGTVKKSSESEDKKSPSKKDDDDDDLPF